MNLYTNLIRFQKGIWTVLKRVFVLNFLWKLNCKKYEIKVLSFSCTLCYFFYACIFVTSSIKSRYEAISIEFKGWKKTVNECLSYQWISDCEWRWWSVNSAVGWRWWDKSVCTCKHTGSPAPTISGSFLISLPSSFWPIVHVFWYLRHIYFWCFIINKIWY